MKLKKTDKVMVMAGRDKGKTGEITRIIPTDGQVVVEGVNVIKKHQKPTQKQPRGGIIEITKPVPAGKVALVCPNCKKPTRVGYEVKGEHKERICRKCKGVIK